MHIGLYFGSFNPIHTGHLIIANHILNETGLHKIWLMVSPQNPFKPSHSLLNEYDRFHLVQKAIEHDPRLKASDLEFGLPKPSYTVHTLAYLKEKYSRPIYGAEGGIKSLNFKDWTWVRTADGVVLDPYKLLPKMFDGISDKDFEKLMSDEDDVRDGGAAMTAYAKLQYEEMSDFERNEIRAALLRYCELDTLAMVMIYEGWREMINGG